MCQASAILVQGVLTLTLTDATFDSKHGDGAFPAFPPMDSCFNSGRFLAFFDLEENVRGVAAVM